MYYVAVEYLFMSTSINAITEKCISEFESAGLKSVGLYSPTYCQIFQTTEARKCLNKSDIWQRTWCHLVDSGIITKCMFIKYHTLLCVFSLFSLVPPFAPLMIDPCVMYAGLNIGTCICYFNVLVPRYWTQIFDIGRKETAPKNYLHRWQLFCGWGGACPLI